MLSPKATHEQLNARAANKETDKQQRVDLNIPVIYQSLSANTQNLLDRLNNDVATTSTGCATIATAGVPLKSRESSFPNNDSSVFENLSEAMTHAYAETYQVIKNEAPPTINPDCECNVNLKRQSMFRLSERIVPTEKPLPVSKPDEDAKKLEEKVDKMFKKQEIIFDDHLLPLEKFLERHGTTLDNGLDAVQVEQKRQSDGKNVMPKKKRKSLIITYLKELIGGYNVIMWMAAVLCFLCWKPLGYPNPDIYNLILSCILAVAIVCQATFSFIQQFRTDNLIASFEKLMPHITTVLRNGKWENINSWELVTGDIVRLSAGDKIPADIRLTECNQASVETSALTGEIEPIKLSISAVDSNPYETKNIVLFGSMLLEGTLTGVVFHIGPQTVMARIADLTQNTSKDLSTMEREINYFAIVIGTLSITTGVLTFIIWFFAVRVYHPDFLAYTGILIACIGVVVSFFPEGLQIAVTMTLTLVANKMKKVHVLVKKLSIIETLGSTTVIASDKTGTITMNRMSLVNLSVCGLDDQRFLDKISNEIPSAYELLMKLVGLCNKAILDQHDDKTKNPGNEQKFIGSATEVGILKCILDYVAVFEIRKKNPLVFEIPFNSKYKYHLSVHRFDKESLNVDEYPWLYDMIKDSTHMVIMKGAPEVIAEFCTHGLNDGMIQEYPLMQQTFIDKAHYFAGNGKRVLGLAFGFVKYDEKTNDYLDDATLSRNLCFFGLLSLIDPPRPGVSDAVSVCHEGGIKVMMVTGDHRLTAISIARMVNIIRSKEVKYFEDVKALVENNPKYEGGYHKSACHCKRISLIEWIKNKILPKQPALIAKKYHVDGAVVIQGKDIPAMDDQHWDYVLSHNEIVFARTTPQNKLAIVKQLQRRGEIVTVTGDGVNDAPALKKADIGIAMGIAGTEISKEAAQVIIIDDNFSTIVNGIRQGRLLFDNLKKVIAYLLPAGCFSEILPVLAYVFFGLPLPLTTLQMIVICLGTDIIGSLGMVYEYQESDLMKRKPRNAAVDHLISFQAVLKVYFQTGLIQSVIAFFMYFFTMFEYGIEITQLVFAFEKWNVEGDFAGANLETRQQALREAQTAYFVALVMTQIINLFTVRTRFQSFFKQKFRPSLLLLALGEISIVLFLCFTRPLHEYLETTEANWYHFVFPLLMGLFIFAIDELKKALVRKFPKTCFAKLAW